MPSIIPGVEELSAHMTLKQGTTNHLVLDSRSDTRNRGNTMFTRINRNFTALMMLALAFQMLLFGTQYCSFRDIFGSNEPSGPPAAQDDGQLVA